MLTLARILKRRASVAAFVVLLFGVFIEVAAQRESRSAAGAPRFVSLEGRFSISLPNESSLTRLTIPTPVGHAFGNWYEWRTKEATFAVGYADSFEPIDDPKAIKQVFEGVTERLRKFVEANDGKIVVDKKIMLDKYSGVEQRADLLRGSTIQRTYLVSRRIYETVIVVKNSQREYESTAVGVLNSFKLLSDSEITEEALKAGPGPLPQTPEAPRAGSDVGDEGLRGPVKSIRTENRYRSETPSTKMLPRFSITTYNEKGNKLREESYDFKNNLSQITVYGYLDGYRVSASKSIEREYDNLPPVRRGVTLSSNKEMDPRYQHRFEYKYDEKKRLIEEIDFLSNGEIVQRHVYKYEGNRKEELLYLENSSLAWRDLYILDDKGNKIEDTDFERDGSVSSKISYTYNFDSHGNWTKRTNECTEL
jgi:hypothetical protein